MEGMISIRREKLAVKYYLLPLQLIGTGNNNVMYDDAVHYMVISRSYQNPIIDQSAADPTVILANDGYFYLYALVEMYRFIVLKIGRVEVYRFCFYCSNASQLGADEGPCHMGT